MPKSRKIVVVGSAIAVFGILIVGLYYQQSLSMSGNADNKIPPNVSVVSIPEGINNPNSINYGKVHLQPQTLHVMLNDNSTVRWVNNDFAYHWIVADENSDRDFRNATPGISPAAGSIENYKSANVIPPSKYFEYTFTKEGTYTYVDGNGGERGTIIVSP